MPKARRRRSSARCRLGGEPAPALPGALGIAFAASHPAGERPAAGPAGRGAAVSRSIPEWAAGGAGHRAARTGAGVRRRAGRECGFGGGSEGPETHSGRGEAAAAPADRPDAGCRRQAVCAGRHGGRRFAGARGTRRRGGHRTAAAGGELRAGAQRDRLAVRPALSLLPHDKPIPLEETTPGAGSWNGSRTSRTKCG